MPAMFELNSPIFKLLRGMGVWLCPNDHLYFVRNCTAPTQSGKCEACAKPIGLEEGEKYHTGAPGNRRIGRLDKHGNIIPDNPFQCAKYGMERYDADKLAPKGYVLTEGTNEQCRGLNEICVCIVRLMVNAILFVHSSGTNTSEAFVDQTVPKEEVTSKLKMIVTSYITLKQKLCLSFDHVMCLMHGIIDEFQKKFPKKK
eukprot:368907_1